MAKSVINTDSAKTGQANPETSEDKDQGDSGFNPITSQEAFDKAIGERLARERARYADYEQIKAKAAAYEQTLEASKTQEQKIAEKLAANEAKIAELETKANRAELESKRAKIAADTGVPVELLPDN